MNRIPLAAATAALLAALVAPQSLDAQQRPRRRAALAAHDAITRTINDCEDRTDDFRKALRKALKDSPLDDTRRQDEMNREADRLENALDRTGDAWNKDHDRLKTRANVQDALTAARDINTAMLKWKLQADAERQWHVVRSELNRLARAFNLNEVRW
jgi:HAMP domain-containing protein